MGMEDNDSQETRSASEAVIQEVAEQEGIQPGEMNPPLFEAVDPEALDRVLRDTGSVSFEYHGYLVTVDHSANVNLQPIESE